MKTAIAEKQANPVDVIRHQLGGMTEQFKAALPAHIPVERFARVVMTAVQNNPALLRVERRSLWNAAMKAAQDGLLPDGREGAIVSYRDKNRGEIAQWMPMIAGLRKKVRNSGEIATWDAQVVHANDAFEFELGDDPFIRHRPALGDPGKVIAAYSIAVLKSGEKSREVMSIAAIEKVRQRSRAKDAGPWITDFEEMCRKTVARRHSKVLPMSTDLDDLIRRDDELYDLSGAKEDAKASSRPTLAQSLDQLAALPEPTHDPNTGEVIEGQASSTETVDAGDVDGDSEDTSGQTQADTHDQLLDQAREAALRGTKRFKLWKGKLTVTELASLAPHEASLEAAAKQADASEKTTEASQ